MMKKREEKVCLGLFRYCNYQRNHFVTLLVVLKCNKPSDYTCHDNSAVDQRSRYDVERVSSLTFRFDSCPKVLLHTLHSYLILPFCFFSGYGSAL